MSGIPTPIVPKLSSEEVVLLDRVADVLIPEFDGYPSASSAGVGLHWIHVALRLRPETMVSLRHVLEQMAGSEDIALLLRDVGRRDPEIFSAFANLVAGAYLMSPVARAAIGYPGQEARPLTSDVEDSIDLLERVVERGNIFRPTPEESP